MTYDVIALTVAMPDLSALLNALMDMGEDLRIDAPAEGGVIHLYDPVGALLLSIDVPIYVQVPGEARRLLGASAPAEPLWWTEARAVARPAAAAHARTFADALATRLGGTVVVCAEVPQ